MPLYLNGNQVVGGGASSLEELTDVTIDSETLTGGQTIVYDDTNDEWVNGEGGGKHWEGTYSEYLSLETKDPDTVYFITDISDSNDRFQPVIYSEDEREIGVFTDGKPLYQKTLHLVLTSPIEPQTATAVQLTGLTAADIDFYRFVSVNGGYYGTQNYISTWLILNFESNDTGAEAKSIRAWSKGQITIWMGANYGNFPQVSTDNRIRELYITVQYTKITDTAGSGQWTPSGVPAHHYSTSEHIVGTWIDGSTLYERTFNPTSLNLPDQTWTSDVLGTSGIVITNWEGYLKFSGLTALFPLTYYRHSNEYVTITTNDTCSDLNIRPNASGLTVGSLMITIRYTKTPS